MHALDIIERLRNPQPARQNGDVGDEANITHKPVALGPGITPEHSQFTLIGSQAEDGVQGRGLPRPVGSDDAKDPALFDTQIDPVQCDVAAEGLPQAACFYACHGFSSSPRAFLRLSALRRPRAADGFGRSAVLPPLVRAVRWLRRSWAIPHSEISAVRPRAAGSARRA